MRVVFLGNHTVGIKAIEAIRETDEIVGVVAHPFDPEDGVKYSSVYDYAIQQGYPVVRLKGKDPTLQHFISTAKPDLIWITDFRYLLPLSLISIPPRGTINLHPSLLPKYRGRASINWAILNGETTLGLTAHFVDAGMDTGDIIAQVSFELRDDQDVGDALEIIYPLYSELTRQVLGYFHSGQVPRRKQDHNQATSFPRRRPEDGLIDWSKSVHLIRNQIRAVASPYPGAFTIVAGCKITVWKASASSLSSSGHVVPGMVIAIGPMGTHIQCGDGILLLTHMEFETAEKQCILKPGMVLGA